MDEYIIGCKFSTPSVSQKCCSFPHAHRPLVNCIDYLTEQGIKECYQAAEVGACCVMSRTLDIGHTQ